MRTIKIIPSLDVLDLQEAVKLVRNVDSHSLIYGYKVGFSLGLNHGLPATVRAIRAISSKPIIYDHQKGGTDIPDTGVLFAKTMKAAGITEAILFPQSGPKTLQAWIDALRAEGVKVIVGSIMTHEGYLASEGGFLTEDGVRSIFEIALRNDVKAFVVPLTKPALIKGFVSQFQFSDDVEFYSPGYGAQGGSPKEFSFIRTHYLIIGRALLNAPDPMAYLDTLAGEVKALV